MTSSLRPLYAVLAWCWLLILVLTTGLLAWHSLTDRDVWLHARVGQDILAGEGFPHTNTYSFTFPDAPWVNHEWAFQVLVALLAPATDDPAAGVGGWHGLRVCLALGLVLVLLLGDGVRERLTGAAGGGALLAVGTGLLLGLGLLWTRLILRPELVSFICLALVLRDVERALGRDAVLAPPGLRTWLDPRRPGGRALLTTVVWVQFHGFAAAAPAVWILGLVGTLLGPLLRVGTAERRPAPGRILAIGAGGALLALAALAASPNGTAGWSHPLRVLAQFGGGGPDLGGMISELVPLLETTNALATTLLVFRLSLVWGVLWIAAQWGRISLLRILVWLATIAIALAGQRGLGPYAVAFMLLHTAPAAGPRTPWSAWCSRPGRRVLLAPVATALLLATLVVVAWPRLADDRFYLREGVARRFGGGLTPAHAPLEAARWLSGHGYDRVVANVDAAGCLLAGTAARLWIDGRTEAYPPDAWRAYDVLRGGGDRALSLLQSSRPDAVCLTTGGVFDPLALTLTASTAWRLAHAGEAATVFVPASDAAGGTSPAARIEALMRRTDAPDEGTARRADLCLAASYLGRLAGDHDKVLTALRRGAALRPDHAILRHNLGTAYLARREFAEARIEFEAALAANPRLSDAAVNAGVCAVELGDPNGAEAAFRRAVDINPRQFQAWANLGGLLARRGEFTAALEAVSRALELRPGDPRLRAARDQLRQDAPRR